MCLIRITITRKITRHPSIDTDMSTTDHTIPNLFHMCKLAFHKCLTFPDLYKDQWAQNCLVEFNHFVHLIGPALISSQISDSQGAIDQLDKAKDALLSLHQSLMDCVQCAEDGSSCVEAMMDVESALESLDVVKKEVGLREIRLGDVEGGYEYIDPGNEYTLEAGGDEYMAYSE